MMGVINYPRWPMRYYDGLVQDCRLQSARQSHPYHSASRVHFSWPNVVITQPASPTKQAHGLVLLYFFRLWCEFLMESWNLFTQILQGFFTDTGTISVSVMKSSRVKWVKSMDVKHNKSRATYLFFSSCASICQKAWNIYLATHEHDVLHASWKSIFIDTVTCPTQVFFHA